MIEKSKTNRRRSCIRNCWTQSEVWLAKHCLHMYTHEHIHTHVHTYPHPHTYVHTHTVGGHPQTLSKILMSGGSIASVDSHGVFHLHYAAQAARGPLDEGEWWCGYVCSLYRGKGPGAFGLGIVLSRGPRR